MYLYLHSCYTFSCQTFRTALHQHAAAPLCPMDSHCAQPADYYIRDRGRYSSIKSDCIACAEPMNSRAQALRFDGFDEWMHFACTNLCLELHIAWMIYHANLIRSVCSSCCDAKYRSIAGLESFQSIPSSSRQSLTAQGIYVLNSTRNTQRNTRHLQRKY